ncbi:MAG: hypothetical protein GX074_05325 [Erysipelothrix sp.]|nr:hypothetical protein [Erysipelothrix sp.]
MKGAYEYFVIVLLGFTFVLVGFSMVELTLNYNQARLYQETIVSLIERNNRFDASVIDLIAKSDQKCPQCTYAVVADEDKFLVKVQFKINIIVLAYSRVGEIKTYTQSIL